MDPTLQTNEIRGPLFVVSMWRGGSTLLYALLNQHPQVNLMWEADLPLLSAAFFKPKFLRDWPNRWEFWSLACSRHKIAPASLDRRMDFRTALESVYRNHALKKRATIWGDKSPNYYDRMMSLARQFHGSRFIVVWRNPADTARSMVRAAAGGNTYFRKRGMNTRSLLGYAVLHRQFQMLLRGGVPVYAVNFEDVTHDTERVMKEVCEFLDLPFDPRVAALEGGDRSAIAAGQHHELSRGNTIVADPQRVEVLSPEALSKIERYVRLWQRKSAWPAYPPSLSRVSAGIEPSLFEKFKDLLEYRFWRFFDYVTAFVFAYAPLNFLQRYRKRSAQGSAETH